MEFISDSIVRCHVAELANADSSSYDVGSLTSVKKVPGEYLSAHRDSLSDLLGKTELVALGVWVEWFKAESFDCAESTDSVLDVSATCEVDLVLWAGHHEGLACLKKIPFILQ